MFNQKVLFVDVDQTLYDNKNKKLYQSTIDIMEKISKREDIDVFLATGRSITTLDHLKEIMPYFKGFVTNNGQSVIVNQEMIYENPVPKEYVQKLENYCNENNIPLGYVSDYNLCVNFSNPGVIKALEQFQLFNVEELDKKPYPYERPVKQFWFFEFRDKIEQASKAIPELDFVYWPGPYGCDCLNKNCSKVDGIKEVIKYYQYELENTYAIGDGDNDVSMFQQVKHSICMGNGTKLAKEAAEYITDRIEEDGFANALEKIFKL